MSFKIPEGDKIAFDTETTGLNSRKGDLPYCFSFCNAKGDTSVILFPVDPFTRKVKYFLKAVEFRTLYNFFTDPTIVKIAHNAQFDYRMCEAAGIPVKGTVVCTMSLIRVTRSNAPLSLKKFCAEYLGMGEEDEKELHEQTREARREARSKGWKVYEGAIEPDFWLAPSKVIKRYARTDAARCMAVYQSLRPNVNQELWKQELKTWKILRCIEDRGIRVFPEKIEAQKEDIKKKLLMYQTQAFKIVSKKINLNSSLQLRKIFYEKLHQRQQYFTKSGLPSVDVDALKNIKHPLAKIILSVRACIKTLEFMDQYDAYMENGIIHPTIHQAMTVTGRESCSNPNLQQVGSGRNDKGIDVLVEARSVFGPRKGYRMRSYDWKNIEVFIPAFASEEEVIIEILKKGGDLHQVTADTLSKTINHVITRDSAKRTFFGLLYGIGPKKLSKTIGITEEGAELIIDGFRRAYPILYQWMYDLKVKAQMEGKITTAYGRVIYLSAEENYKTPNYYVQGTAGGILRTAKIKIFELFKKEGWDCHMVLPIHDELLIEISEKQDLNTVDKAVVACMQDNPELKMPIPIPVSVSAIGQSWFEKVKIKTL